MWASKRKQEGKDADDGDEHHQVEDTKIPLPQSHRLPLDPSIVRVGGPGLKRNPLESRCVVFEVPSPHGTVCPRVLKSARSPSLLFEGTTFRWSGDWCFVNLPWESRFCPASRHAASERVPNDRSR